MNFSLKFLFYYYMWDKMAAFYFGTSSWPLSMKLYPLGNMVCCWKSISKNKNMSSYHLSYQQNVCYKVPTSHSIIITLIILLLKIQKVLASPAGNRTPVSCVTGRDTYHYTTEDWLNIDWFNWVINYWVRFTFTTMAFNPYIWTYM